MRGYYGVGIYHTKTETNVGTLWRSAYQLGAAFVFTIGKRYVPQASDTTKTWRSIPLFHYADWEAFQANRPYDTPLIGVEMGGHPLEGFYHPPRAIYLLGAEDHGLPPEIIARCQSIVSLDSIRQPSFNVAVAGSLVLYHRFVQTKEHAL